MLKLEHAEVLGWEHAIRGMRNPMNSWEKSDSETCNPFTNCFYSCDESECEIREHFHLGSNDHDLMMRLAKGGPVHAKYRRMIAVYVDITAPLYWWKEFDTYKVGTVANSCSTMHKIAAKEFTLEDFSCEHLITPAMDILKRTIDALNTYRGMYLNFDIEDSAIKRAFENDKKNVWWQMIQLLPTSYNQKRTIMLNYEVLAGIYPSRKDHKLDEWHTFCDWIEDLPYSEIITGIANEEHKKLIEDVDKILETTYPKLVKVSIMPDGTAEPRFMSPTGIGKRAEVPGIIDDWSNIPEENWPTACNLCNEHGCGDSDEEVCKKCHFYQYSKWANGLKGGE